MKTTTKSGRVRKGRLLGVMVVVVVVVSVSLLSMVKAEGTNGGHDPTRHFAWEPKRKGMDDMELTRSSPSSTTEPSQRIVKREDDRPLQIPPYDTIASIRHHHNNRGRRHRQMPLEQWLVNRSKQGSITIEVGGQERDTVALPHRRLNEPHGQSFHPQVLTEAPPTTTNTTGAVMSINENTTTTQWRTPFSGKQRVGRSRSPRRRMLNRPDHPTVELTVSISPTSLFRLLRILGVASAGALGAFGATLRLVAPMIVARRLISSIGYICYDYYNGRYIRTTYHKRLRNLEELEIPSALRACGRMGAQLFVMVVVGGITRMLLQAAPCGLPDIACRYWFGSMWVGSVLLAGSSVERWMQRFPALQVQPAAPSATNSKLVLTQPWHILQWMKDPETWLLNLTRLQHRQRRPTIYKPFRPDLLLFPSTWPPLMILSATAMIHAVAQTLPIKTGANTRMLMQDFCLAVTILDEWKRLFLYEHRIALGLAWSAISFGAFFVLSVSAAFEVGWISCGLLLPMVFSCLVSGWMNAVLYSEYHVQNQ